MYYTQREKDSIIPVVTEMTDHGVIRRHFSKAARDLGVSRSHLHKVLMGERQSVSLMERIRQLHPELLTLTTTTK